MCATLTAVGVVLVVVSAVGLLGVALAELCESARGRSVAWVGGPRRPH